MATKKRTKPKSTVAARDEQLLNEVEERIADGRRKYHETQAQLERSRRLIEEIEKFKPKKP